MPQTADVLSHMGDEELVAMAQAGSDAAMEHLLRRYSRFVQNRTKRYFLPGGDRDDVVQEGMIGLFKAVRDYIPGNTFRTFAELCIGRQMITAVKTHTRQKHLMMNDADSLDAPLEDGDCPADVVVDHRSPEALMMDSLAVLSVIRMMRAVLSPLEAATAACFIEDDTYHEAADRLGVSLKCVDNARQRVRVKMGPALARMEAV